MSFKDSYLKRKEYGNDSEKRFIEYCDNNKIAYSSFGIEHFLDYHKIKYSDNKYKSLSNQLKKQPDYIIFSNNNFYFIECKSSGVDKNKEYVLRIKEDDVNGYYYWNIFRSLYIFVTYNFNTQSFFISLENLILEMKKTKQQVYEDNQLTYRTIYINELIKHKL